MKNNDNVRIRRIMVSVKDMEIEFDEYYKINPENGEEVFDRNIEIENDIRLYDIYKKRVNLLTTNEIKLIRKKYGMNQKEFSQALGFGEITIHRFENGSIQTEAVDAVIRLSEEPDIMYKLLIKNKSNFNEEEYLRFMEVIKKLKVLKDHRIAEFNANYISSLDFETIDAKKVANRLIVKYNNKVNELSKKYDIDNGIVVSEYITPLKLQKLLYYIQGLSAIIFGKPAFNNDMVSWSYGPVVEEIYKIYNGRSPISTPSDSFKISNGLEKIIDIVISSYGQIEAEKLIELTHNEDPWISVEKNDVIDFEKIKKYFQKVYES